MKRREEIVTELHNLESTLTGADNQHPFTVPEEYFAHLPGVLLTQVQLLKVRQNPVYVIPEQYFDRLPAGILQRIKDEEIQTPEEEINSLSPLLAGLRKEPVYAVPGNYFNKPLSIPVQEETPAKLVRMPRRRNWISYAAAAVVTGIMITAAYTYWPAKSDTTTPVTADVSKEVSSLSDDDILSYLNASSNPANDIVADDNAANEEGYFHLISDKEIQEYLSDNEEPKDDRNSGI